MSEFASLTFLHWWIFALVLLILEIFVSGTFLIWLGFSAGIIGFILLAYPSLPWQMQLFLFAVFSLVAVMIWRQYLKRFAPVDEAALLNRRGEQYVGRVFSLEDAIVNGIGKIKVDDTVWKVSGPDLARTRRVKVIGTDGTLLRVEPDDSA